MLLLYGLGLVATVLAVGFTLVVGGEEEEEKETLTEFPPPIPFRKRIPMMMSDSLAMVFAWCLLFSTRYVFVRIAYKVMAAVAGRIILALTLSIFAGLIVFGLDAIDDLIRHRASAAAAVTVLNTVIGSLAILIGFSWESCFDAGVAAVSSSAVHRRVCKFAMGTAVFVFLVPAWKRHILTKVMALEDMKAHRMRALHKKSSHGSSYTPLSQREHPAKV